MITPLTIWTITIAVMAIVVLANVLKITAHHRRHNHCTKHNLKPIGLESEQEIFFVPGDPDPHHPEKMFDDDL